ncbi:hypothetical protein Y032_0004g1724 [Ancylostoma ceylanicum]|uniref:Fibronectin type-III domain-containing protein n=1 Tax=Ancylostoma ceylanicum TaxID=53326 RepID=A0A016VTR3_9BILA|nr:hypothetical protein Y032_0004g1724 [Ancylostoma ceylanicum]
MDWYRLALKLIMARFFSPHLMLVVSCALYIIFGALMFQRLEGEHLKQVKREQTENIAESGQAYIDRIWELTHQERDKYENIEDLVRAVKKISTDEFHDYVDTVFTAHRAFIRLHEPAWLSLTAGAERAYPRGIVSHAHFSTGPKRYAAIPSFGDFRPSHHNIWTTLAVVLGGVILTTMCMDVVGRMYLKEIHYLGRKLKSNNPFYLIREAKARRRRAAMASLLAQLARGMIFAHKDYNELSRKKSKKKRAKRRGSHVLPNEKFMFARLPPDPPSDCQVISTSAYSVRIAWAPAFSTESDLTYNIRYRLKHNEDGKIRELRGIKGNAVEIMSVDSCSLYEFRITAVSKYGESKPIYLVQYTEPQLSPQHILATKLNPNTIELTWEPPFKRTHDVKNYIVYFTENPNASLSEWEKIPVNGRRVVFPDLRYDWFYMFSATAVFKDGQRSPLSRALFIKTDKLEFHKHCVGQSRTIEVMDSICDRTEDSETTALLKRDYASFAV